MVQRQLILAKGKWSKVQGTGFKEQGSKEKERGARRQETGGGENRKMEKWKNEISDENGIGDIKL